MSDGCQVCSYYIPLGGGLGRAYWTASMSSSPSPVPWLEPEDASLLDSVAPPSSSPASSLPDSSDLEEPPLEELP
jgi:hypothetical protein